MLLKLDGESVMDDEVVLGLYEQDDEADEDVSGVIDIIEDW